MDEVSVTNELLALAVRTKVLDVDIGKTGEQSVVVPILLRDRIIAMLSAEQSARAEMEREIAELREERALVERRLVDANQRIDRLLAYTKKLERGIVQPEWFYFGDETTSDMCTGSVEEAMEDGLDDLTRAEAETHQPFEISTATSLPSIWVTIQTFDVEDPAPYQRDWDFEITEHASLEEAQATPAKAQRGEG